MDNLLSFAIGGTIGITLVLLCHWLAKKGFIIAKGFMYLFFLSVSIREIIMYCYKDNMLGAFIMFLVFYGWLFYAIKDAYLSITKTTSNEKDIITYYGMHNPK